MSCLYIDASRDRLSVGIEVGSDWIAYDAVKGRHDAVLLESIRSLCIESGQSVNKLSQCVVINGPGSFTGLRIAVSCIHALDLVHPLRVLPVDQLSLLAAASENEADYALLDARMNEVYVGICHAEEIDRFPVSPTPVSPTLETLRRLASGMNSSKWIPGQQLAPLYLRQIVSWKPLSEQPSKLYDD